MPNKPTQTRTQNPFPELDDLDDLLNPRATSPLARVEPEPEQGAGQQGRAADPSLRRASGAETRRATSGIDLPGHMRDLLNRLPTELGADEIDDAEAARRAGQGDNDPREPGTDLVTRQTLPSAVANAVQVSGVRNPKWHTINNLPGYMSRAIRGMGRGMFNMITNTPLEDILTIANLNDQGPNSPEELRAVAGWLRDNAEEVRGLDFDYSQLMPGYQPDVKEYRTDGIRFHVVQDPMGQYIYAYPEQDAKGPGDETGQLGNGPRRLGNGPRRLGGPQNESKENTMSMTLTESIRSHLYLLEEIQLNAQLERDLDEMMEDIAALEAYKGKASKERYWSPEKQKERMSKHSTLGPLLSKNPGGPNLISWLHKEMNLGSKASWGDPESKYGSGIEGDKIKDARVMWTTIKNNPDNFIVFIGEEGVAGMRPTKGYIEKQTAAYERMGKVYNPASDKSLPYHYAIFTADSRKYVQDPEAITGSKSKRGGLPFAPDVRNVNMLDQVKNEIGRITSAWAAFPGQASDQPQSVERGKVATRASYKDKGETRSQQQLEDAVFAKVRPVMKKLIASAYSILTGKLQKFSAAGNFDAVEKFTRAAKRMEKISAGLNVEGTPQLDWELKSAFKNALQNAYQSYQETAQDGDVMDFPEFLSFMTTPNSPGGVIHLRHVLDAYRQLLIGAA